MVRAGILPVGLALPTGSNAVAGRVMMDRLCSHQGGERFRLWTLIQEKRAGAGERPP